MANMNSPLNKQSMISSFLEVAVGQTVDTAHYFLQAANWRIEDAMQLFYVGNEGQTATSSSYTPPIASTVLLSDHIYSGLEEDKRTAYATQGAGQQVCPPLHMVSDNANSDEEILIHVPVTSLPRVRTEARIEVPMSNLSSAPALTPCASGETVKRKRGRPRKTPLVSGTTTPAAEPALPPIGDLTSNMASVPAITASASGVAVKRKRGRPRTTSLVSGTSTPASGPALPPIGATMPIISSVSGPVPSVSDKIVRPRRGRPNKTQVGACSMLRGVEPSTKPIEAHVDYMSAPLQNLVARSRPVPSVSVKSSSRKCRHPRPRQKHLVTLGSGQLTPTRCRRTRLQIDADARTSGASSHPNNVVDAKLDPVYKGIVLVYLKNKQIRCTNSRLMGDCKSVWEKHKVL